MLRSDQQSNVLRFIQRARVAKLDVSCYARSSFILTEDVPTCATEQLSQLGLQQPSEPVRATRRFAQEVTVMAMRCISLHKHPCCVALFLLFLLICGQGCGSRPAVPSPEWQGIVPGVSTESDVIRLLGEPARKNLFEDKAAYAYGGDRELPIFFLFRNGRVMLICDTRVNELSLGLFLKEYGEPEQVTWAPLGSPPATRLFIFAHQGMAIVADNQVAPGESRVREKWYFEPTTLERFLDEIASLTIPDHDVTGADPYPEGFWLPPSAGEQLIEP
jgi:hypothetical protein